MHQTHLKPNLFFQIISYNILLYGTLIWHLLSSYDLSLLILVPIYGIFALIIFVISLIRKIEKAKYSYSLNNSIKIFILYTLLFFPLIHFILFESYFMGQASSFDAALFFTSGRMALYLAPLGGLLLLLFDLIHTSAQKLFSAWTSKVQK